MGIAMRARARIQINLAVSQVLDIKQVANFPDIIFPILWFEEVSRLFSYPYWYQGSYWYLIGIIEVFFF
jgi:hypothetical protein